MRYRRLFCFAVLAILSSGLSPLRAAVKLLLRDGRPVADGIYVNGHGPFRFLIDTGSNINLIQDDLAANIGMASGFTVEMASAAGKTSLAGSDSNQIVLDTASATGQRFLFSSLKVIHRQSPDVQGVLGQWFLSGFDYSLDLKARRLDFGPQIVSGTRIVFRNVNARPVFTTSLGELALDSGQPILVLFGTAPPLANYRLLTLAGAQTVGAIEGKRLTIQGKAYGSGQALAVPARPEDGVDGLMPISLFQSIYICNSRGFAVFR